jgi:ATP-dependent Clp protease ATP-binding subunit ClpA
MWQRFSERSRKVVFYAQEEAQKVGAAFVGTEAMALGMMRDHDSTSYRAIKALEVDMEELAEGLQGLMGSGAPKPDAEMTLTPAAKRLIDFAYDSARALDHNYIGTEHLLLGCVRTNDETTKLFANFGITHERALAAVVGILGISEPPARPESFIETIKRRLAGSKGGESMPPAATERMEQDLKGALPRASETTWWSVSGEEAHACLSAAWDSARMCGDTHVSSLHLFVGSIKASAQVRAAVGGVGTDPEELATSLSEMLGTGSLPNPVRMALTDDSRDALVVSMGATLAMKSEEVTALHLLLGLCEQELVINSLGQAGFSATMLAATARTMLGGS